MEFTEPGTFLRSHGKVGFLGVAPFGAIGIKCAKPDQEVIAAIGDGDARWGNIADALWTAKHHDKPVMYVIDNNHQLTTTKSHQVHYPKVGYAKGNYWAQHLTDPYMDFTKLAEASDVWAKRVMDPENLESVMTEAFNKVKNGEPALVDVWTRPLKVGNMDHAWPGYEDYPE